MVLVNTIAAIVHRAVKVQHNPDLPHNCYTEPDVTIYTPDLTSFGAGRDIVY